MTKINGKVTSAKIDKKENKAGEAMYAWRNIEAQSSNNCWHGKEISVAYSECRFVALIIHHTKRRIIL
jgi:hypothetical protein